MYGVPWCSVPEKWILSPETGSEIPVEFLDHGCISIQKIETFYDQNYRLEQCQKADKNTPLK